MTFGLEIELERFIDTGMVVLQDEADNEYEAEQEVADEFDSDFNDDVGALICISALHPFDCPLVRGLVVVIE